MSTTTKTPTVGRMRQGQGTETGARRRPGTRPYQLASTPRAKCEIQRGVHCGSSCIFFRRRSTTAIPFHSQDRRTQDPLTQSRQNGDFKPSEGGFGGITELWINERGQGAATTAAQAGAERSLLCGAHCSM
ncbi:uncharacterized protein FMAN_04311 [Fusarium mangiferae]|uniref:Uncharacterized protein n=1 Tax=Fusarium mangiferae TaxID=192010 RepID=A0A1L7SZV4_FUSMA|nr:uncharacterized protein FMAN_04311 [Fusarium mangiferae]CVK89443.1 uncharacterized protein FMAN_04311 [Fusarium mangiferae]